MAEYFTHISNGSGEATGHLISIVGASISGLGIALYICPYYALCLLIYFPFATITMFAFLKSVTKAVIMKMGLNAKLGGFTEEMLSSLKLIISFGMEKDKLDEYKRLAMISYK